MTPASRALAACKLLVTGTIPLSCGGGESAHPGAVGAMAHLEGPEVVLAGQVTDERGVPLAGATVIAKCRSAESDEVRASSETRTDEHGGFRIETLPAGDIEVEASLPDLRPALRALGSMSPIDAREDLELELADGSELGGRVHDARGAPAPGALVFVESAGGECKPVVCDPRGSFHARGLGEGPFRVTAIARAEGTHACEIVTGRGVPAGTKGVELVVRGSGTLEVVASGAPLEDAFWFLLDPDGVPAGETPTGSAALRDALRCVEGFEPGSYWLDVEDEERLLAARCRVLVEEGRTTAAEVELVPATRLEVRALADGEPVLFDLVLLSSDGFVDRAGYRTCIMKDFAVTRLLPPGTYHVEARDGDRRAEAELTLSGEPRRELRLALE